MITVQFILPQYLSDVTGTSSTQVRHMAIIPRVGESVDLSEDVDPFEDVLKCEMDGPSLFKWCGTVVQVTYVMGYSELLRVDVKLRDETPEEEAARDELNKLYFS